MGYSFVYPLFKVLGGCKVLCYVHYPTISTDMIQTVGSSTFKGKLKLVYYRLFARLYAYMGRFAELVMVNSSWTKAHIDSLWNVTERTSVIYPPCDTTAFLALPLAWEKREPIVVSVGQFRPEKNHALQLEAFALFLRQGRAQSRDYSAVRLVLIGSCRGTTDKQRLTRLQEQATNLGIQVECVWHANVNLYQNYAF
jgi:alpha-1,2-mannosyltransferase